MLLPVTAVYSQEKSPRLLIEAWEKSWNSYDLNEVKRLFVNDSSVTYFSSERAGLIHGIDSLVKHHRSFGFVAGGKPSTSRLWLTQLRYSPNAVTATWHFRRADNSGQQGPVTFILKSSREGYRILHAHFSNDPKGK